MAKQNKSPGCGGCLSALILIPVIVVIIAASVESIFNNSGRSTQSESDQRIAAQMTEAANLRVAAITRKAENAWLAGDMQLAEKLLSSAEQQPHATDFSPIRQLRNRIFETLMAAAIQAVKRGDFVNAKTKVQSALVIPDVNGLDDARKLDEQIGVATDPAQARVRLMALIDDAFKQLQDGGPMPQELVSGYENLDRQMAGQIKAQLAEVAVARKQRDEEHIKELKASLAARKTEYERQLAQEDSRQPWYSGGTLHSATLGQWRRATYRNRLATSADFVAGAAKHEGIKIGGMEQLRSEAVALEAAISATGRGGQLDNQNVSEIAAACLILLHANN